MKKVAHLLVAAVTFVALALGIAGCDGGANGSEPAYDPSGLTDAQKATEFVNGALSLHFTGHSNDFLQYHQGPDADHAADREEELRVDAAWFTAYAGMAFEDLDAETQAAAVELMKKLYAKAEYSVEDAVQDGKSYVVTVKVKPLDVMGLVGSLDWVDLYDAYVDEVADKGMTVAASHYIQGAIALVEAKLPVSDYLDPVTRTVTILIDGEYWSFSTQELQDIHFAAVQYDYSDAS